jgi:DDE family transposase
MDDTIDRYGALLRSGARRLTGYQRRQFQAEVARELCAGSPRAVEGRFGWGRETVRKALTEARTGIRCVEDFAARGRRRSEDRDPALAAEIRAIVEPHPYADPELRSSRRYSNLSSRGVREALIVGGRTGARLPGERALRDILNRMNYRLKRIRKGKPLRKTEDTGAIVENVERVRQESRADPEALGVSMDTKAKVRLGGDSRGGKGQDRLDG